MSDLKSAFDGAGCRSSKTYIQSGNVIFEAATKDHPVMLKRVSKSLRELMGTEPGLFVRSAGQIEALVRMAPFRAFASETDAKFYVAFLAGKPRTSPRLPLMYPKEGLELVRVTDLEAFIVSRRKKNGFYGFPNSFIEEELGVAATSRNWTTVSRLAGLVGDAIPV